MNIDTLHITADPTEDVDCRLSADGVTVGINGRNGHRVTVFLPTDLAAELLGQLSAIASQRVTV
jgi:hypothetical protein